MFDGANSDKERGLERVDEHVSEPLEPMRADVTRRKLVGGDGTALGIEDARPSRPCG